MISHENLMNMIRTEACEGAEDECIDRMNLSQLREYEQREAQTNNSEGVMVEKESKPRLSHTDMSMKMEHFFLRNYGGFPSGCLDHRTREEIARSNQVELDDSNSVKVGTNYIHPKTLKQYWIRVSRPLPAKPRVLKARVLLDDESGGMRMRFV